MTDTRTWRSYPRGNEGYPDLISRDELMRQLPTAAALGGRQLFVVLSTNLSPVPMTQWGADYAQTSILRAKESIRQRLRIEIEGGDSWQPGRVDFFRLLTALSRDVLSGDGSVIVLSGDVHFSFSTRIQYWADQQIDETSSNATASDLVVAQLVSSAAYNRGKDSDGFHANGYRHKIAEMRRTGAGLVVPEFSGQTQAFFGWSTSVASGHPPPAVRFFVPGRPDYERSAVNADMPSYGDFVPTTQDEGSFRVDLPPHYRVLVNHLVAGSGSEHTDPFSTTEIDPLKVRKALLRYGVEAKLRIVEGNELVGKPNVAEVNLQGNFALHFVLRRDSPGGPLKWVRFDVSLSHSDPAYERPKYLGEPEEP